MVVLGVEELGTDQDLGGDIAEASGGQLGGVGLPGGLGDVSLGIIGYIDP